MSVLHRLWHAVPLLLVAAMAGCMGKTTEPIVVGINVNRTTVQTGAELRVSANASGGGELTFEWRADRGTIAPTDDAFVVYTAPADTGTDTITVQVSNSDSSVIRSIDLDVIAPEPPAETATDTPVPTPTPEPIDCDHPSVTKHVFPQLVGETGNDPFRIDTAAPDMFRCEGVYDTFRSEAAAVRIEYDSAAAGDLAGFWGIATPDGYDVTAFSEICFWAYTEQPDQAFLLKLKDLSGTEGEAEVNIGGSGEWTEACTALSEYSDQGVDLAEIENFNLGFNRYTGSATVWVDDFELK